MILININYFNTILSVTTIFDIVYNFVEVFNMSNILELVGERIRDYRKQKGLSQEQLAELCGFHFSYIGGVERGERNIALEGLNKIALALNIEIKLFFEFNTPISNVNIDEKDIALEEISVILRNKDANYIRDIKKIISNIIKLNSK